MTSRETPDRMSFLPASSTAHNVRCHMFGVVRTGRETCMVLGSASCTVLRMVSYSAACSAQWCVFIKFVRFSNFHFSSK